jgi:hypothetical protein
MRMLLAGLGLIMAVGLSGCFGNAAMVEAMKSNNATFCAKVVTPWGGATYLQSNPVFGTASCDGMQISYGNPNPQVPIMLKPDGTFVIPMVK